MSPVAQSTAQLQTDSKIKQIANRCWVFTTTFKFTLDELSLVSGLNYAKKTVAMNETNS